MPPSPPPSTLWPLWKWLRILTLLVQCLLLEMLELLICVPLRCITDLILLPLAKLLALGIYVPLRRVTSAAATTRLTEALALLDPTFDITTHT